MQSNMSIAIKLNARIIAFILLKQFNYWKISVLGEPEESFQLNKVSWHNLGKSEIDIHKVNISVFLSTE